MDTFIACDAPAITQRIRTSFHQLGIDCPAARVLSMSTVGDFVAAARNENRCFALFFGSATFAADDLTSLRQLCAQAGERIKVIAVGQNFNTDVILRAIRCGAVDCLDIAKDFDQELGGVLDRIRVSASEPAHVGQLFTVVASAGGTGASTLAVNLAVAVAKHQGTCGLLDLNLRGGDLSTLLKAQPRHTLFSLAEKADQLDRSMFEQSLLKHDSGVHLLAGPDQFSDFRRLGQQVIQKIVRLGRGLFPSVVVDLEDCEHPEQVRTIAESDRIVIPLRFDYVSLLRTKRLVEHLLRSHVERSHLMLVAIRERSGWR